VSDPADRLERSRLAILEHVHRRHERRRGREPMDDPRLSQDEADARERARHRPGARGWMDTTGELVRGWWQYHPAHAAVELARPVLASYARRKPAQYLGLAALAGAALFFMRPWKLISVTGVVVALLKSPQLAGLVMQAMSASQNPRDDEPEQE